MKKLKTHKFYDALYLADIQFCYGDPVEFNQYIKDDYNVNLTHDPLGVDGVQFSVERDADDGPEKIYFIFLRHVDDLAALAHEIIHLVKDIFVDRGVGVDLETEDEHFTYYHSYLMKLFMSKLKEKKKRKKRLTKKK